MKSATIHRKFKTVLLVGAGGIGCHLAPVLSRLFNLILMDGDSYEPKNVERQFPALTSTGNKAEILAGMIRPNTTKEIEFIPSYIRSVGHANHDLVKKADLIVGCVDNNASRRIIAEVADELEVPCILAGNEELFGEAHLHYGLVYSCFDNFPFKDNIPAPFSCNSDKVLDEAPQTVLANGLAAGATLQLLMSLQTVENPDNLLAFASYDRMTSVTKRVRDYLEASAVAPDPKWPEGAMKNVADV